jgi:hypothetical protein
LSLRLLRSEKLLRVPIMAIYLAPRLLIAALTAFALLQFVIAQ